MRDLGLAVTFLASVVLVGPVPVADPHADCSRPVEVWAQNARLWLAELEYAEDVHREAHWNALGQCAEGADPEACRAAATRRFDALWRERRAAIESRYRRALEDYTARCSTSISRARGALVDPVSPPPGDPAIQRAPDLG
jgi:hypothetical protein